jgi:FkbH-like protein
MKGSEISFLEASKLIKNVQGLPAKNVRIKSSVSLHQLHLYLKAFGAKSGLDLNVEEIEFGTLRQSLYQEDNDAKDIFILFPWDFLGSLDWRTGISSKSVDVSSALKEIDDFFDLVSSKVGGTFFYLEAELPPVTGLKGDMYILKSYISLSAGRLNSFALKSDFFCLKTYLANGCPFSSESLSQVGKNIVSNILKSTNSAKKVIVTDLDFTFWHGVLGEDGPDGIKYLPDGAGYVHFIYQTYLRKLKDSGILLCISSKNDADLVESAFRDNQFIVNYDDFVSIRTSYNSKSSDIETLSHELNIGLNDFVFIDDNPIEIEEVKTALPAVTCIQFPKETGKFGAMMQQVHTLFQISKVTAEDKNRTSLYKRRKKSNLEFSHTETSIDAFLKSLEMEIELFERTAADNDRAVQLINKTNQFNSNGNRISKQQCDQMIDGGARLITAQLRDKNGDHGEILAILIDANSNVLSFVMSCRVFQRQAEIIFLLTILKEFGIDYLLLHYAETERNQPFKMFLSRLVGTVENGCYDITPQLILDAYPSVEQMLKVKGRLS